MLFLPLQQLMIYNFGLFKKRLKSVFFFIYQRFECMTEQIWFTQINVFILQACYSLFGIFFSTTASISNLYSVLSIDMQDK